MSMAELPRPIPWLLARSLSLSYEHSLAYRVDGLPIQREVHTPMRNNEPCGTSDVTYWIDGDDRCFRSEGELRDAYAGAVT